MAKTQHGRELTGAELAQMVDEFVNGHGSSEDVEAFADQICHGTHRTLQQRIMGLFVTTIARWSEQSTFDARNEATIKLAKKIIAATGDKYDRHLPFI